MSERRVFRNPAADRQAVIRQSNQRVRHFHQQILPDYKATKLTRICSQGRLGEVYVKEESDRFGLPAFKVLGSSFATFVELCRIYDLDDNLATLHDLRRFIRQAGELAPTLVTATDGNHGRGLSWFAKQVGLKAHVFVPHTIGQAAIAYIRSEGAIVEQLPLDYDATVFHASKYCGTSSSKLLIQDTSWEGYTKVPRNIVEGYATIFYELQQSQVTHIICPVGVGSLAQACVEFAPSHCRIITVEPSTALCLHKSLQAGKITRVQTNRTIMAGLNCGLVSSDAWLTLQKGVHASTFVSDDETIQAMKELQAQKIDCGPCGAASLAAWNILKKDEVACRQLEINDASKIILLITEGGKAVN